jgi:hypothetical protein
MQVAHHAPRHESAIGLPLPDAYGAKPNAIKGVAAEVRPTAAQCPQLRYRLTECGAAAIDAPAPKPSFKTLELTMVVGEAADARQLENRTWPCVSAIASDQRR